MDALKDVLERYIQARQELCEHYEPFKYELNGELITVSCPACKSIYATFNFYSRHQFNGPIICCGKLRSL